MAEVIASEGGHWYTQEGEPMYEVEKADGSGLRPTTLRDARKLGLVPSVTTIMKEMAAPGLDRWKQKQAVLAARHIRRKKGETDDQFAARVIYKAGEEASRAAEEGSKIHGAIERWMLGKDVADGALWPHVDAVADILYTLPVPINEWVAEKSFAKDGYGGKVDAHANGVVLDFKTKDFDEDTKLAVYDNHFMQLAAYERGLGMVNSQGYILYVSRTVPGLTKLMSVSHTQMTRGWEMFQCLLKLWQVKKGYNGTI